MANRGRYIAEDQALNHVAGYSCFNEASARDWQFHTTQITPGKNFFGTGGFGPWMVTADEIPEPQNLQIKTRLKQCNNARCKHKRYDF